MTLNGSSVPDLHGSPMIVSAIVDYKVIDPLQVAYGIGDLEGFIRNQGLEVLRSACSKFSYRSNIKAEPTLQTDSKLIGGCMKDLL